MRRSILTRHFYNYARYLLHNDLLFVDAVQGMAGVKATIPTTGAATTFHGRALKFGSGDLESRELSFENVIFVFFHAQFT